MAITVKEQFGRRLAGDRGELTYLIAGTDDAAAARGALLSEAPASYGGIPLLDAEVDEIAGAEGFSGRVNYGYSGGGSSPPDPGDSSFTFDTGGGSQHITHSLETVNKYAPPDETAPDHQGAIGVTENGVEGVDITIPTYRWSEKHTRAAADVTQAYKLALAALTGQVNAAGFRGFAAGEVVFLGASGSRQGDDEDDPWDIVFNFARNPNKTGLTVGPITGIAKKGWEYLWVLYREEEDTDAKRIVQRPIAAYVEQVYEGGSFDGMGIGS